MKKSIITAVIVAATSVGAAANPSAELNRGEMKDYTYLSNLSPAMAKLAAGMEFGNPDAVEEALSVLPELGQKEQFLTLAILNNTNLYESEYDSVLDQLITSYGYGSDELQVKYNQWMQDARAQLGGRELHDINGDLKQRGQALAQGSTNGDLVFKATVEPVCGVFVNDAEGELVFRGEDTRNTAKFTVHTNTVNGATVNLVDNSPVIGSLGTISYNVSGMQVTERKELHAVDGQTFDVFAQANVLREDQLAGEYSHATIINISCK